MPAPRCSGPARKLQGVAAVAGSADARFILLFILFLPPFNLLLRVFSAFD